MICPGCGKRVPDDCFALCAECDAKRGISHERHTEETIEDIVAEFREMIHKSVDGIIAVKADVIADRIDAAWKREREAIYGMLDSSIKSQRRIDDGK